jgi:hypothetical protein
MSSLSREE